MSSRFFKQLTPLFPTTRVLFSFNYIPLSLVSRRLVLGSLGALFNGRGIFDFVRSQLWSICVTVLHIGTTIRATKGTQRGNASV